MDETVGDHLNAQTTLEQPRGRALLLCDDRVLQEWVLKPYAPGLPVPDRIGETKKRGGHYARVDDLEGVRRVGDPARPHLRLRLRQDGRTLPAIGFGLGGLPVRVGDRVDIVFRPRLARWQGTERLEAEVLDLRGGDPTAAQTTENAREFGVP